VLVRPPSQRDRIPLRPRFNFHLCRSKHFLKETVTERIIGRSRRIERVEWRINGWRWKVGQDEFIVLFEWDGILFNDPHLALFRRFITLLLPSTRTLLDSSTNRFSINRFPLILFLPQRYRSFRSKPPRLFPPRPNFPRHLLDRVTSETNRSDLHCDRMVWTKDQGSSRSWNDHVFWGFMDV